MSKHFITLSLCLGVTIICNCATTVAIKTIKAEQDIKDDYMDNRSVKAFISTIDDTVIIYGNGLFYDKLDPQKTDVVILRLPFYEIIANDDLKSDSNGIIIKREYLIQKNRELIKKYTIKRNIENKGIKPYAKTNALNKLEVVKNISANALDSLIGYVEDDNGKIYNFGFVFSIDGKETIVPFTLSRAYGKKRFGQYLRIPFALALDVITLPIQLLALLAFKL